MEISSNNLINKDILQVNKFDNIKQENLKDKDDVQLQKVCNDFESFFLNQIMEVSLRSTKIAGEGAGSDIIKGMYTQSVADNSTGSLGISNMLYEFLTQNKKSESRVFNPNSRKFLYFKSFPHITYLS
jgi:Rod binding domain-containing protein